MYKYWIFLILFVYSCDEIISPDINFNDKQFEDNYTINLHAINIGNYFNICTLEWNQYQDNDFESYILKNELNEIIASIEDSQMTWFPIILNPAEFQKIYIDVNNILKDSIEIYTRPIKSITNFSAQVDTPWVTALKWSASEETNEAFQKYELYRSTETLNNFILIDEIINQNDSSYVDSMTVEDVDYYYKINTLLNEGQNRYSIIQLNTNLIAISHEIVLETLNDQYNKINLNWIHNLNEEEFYAIEIWRTQEQLNSPENGFLLATITDYNKKSLEDSYLIGNGISWFYQLKLIDQFGNISYSSIVEGRSHP